MLKRLAIDVVVMAVCVELLPAQNSTPPADPELAALQLQSAILEQKLKVATTTKSLADLESPPDLKKLTDHNLYLSEQLKLATNTKALEDANALGNSELKRLTEENSVLAERLKLATANKSLAEASVPKFTGGLEGSVAFSGDTHAEAAQLAYEALTEIAGKMATDIACKKDDRILIVSAPELNALENLQTFRLQSKLLNDLLIQAVAIDAEVKPPANVTLSTPAALLLAGPVIQSIIDITKLFRVNREIATKDLAPDEKAFLSILAGEMGGCRILHPEISPVSILEELPIRKPRHRSAIETEGLASELKAFNCESDTGTLPEWLERVVDKTALLRIRMLLRTREKTATDQEAEEQAAAVKKWNEQVASISTLPNVIAQLKKKLAEAAVADRPKLQEQIDEKKKELAAARKAKEDPAEVNRARRVSSLQAYSRQLAELLKLLTAALDAGNAYWTDLMKTDAAGVAFLSRLKRSHRLEEQLKTHCGDDCKSSILYLSIQKIAASTLKKTGAFNGTRYSFSGGAIATYLQFGLWDGKAKKALDGSLMKSGTFTAYSGQWKPPTERAIEPVAGKKLSAKKL